MLKDRISNISAFGSPEFPIKDTVREKEGTNEQRKNLDDFYQEQFSFVKRIGFYRMLELAACRGDYILQEKTKEKYAEIISKLTDSILEEKDVSSSKPLHTKLGIGDFPVTDDLKDFLLSYKKSMLGAGLIKAVKERPTCLITGESPEPGELFLRMCDGSSDSVLLSACDHNIRINIGTVVCCYQL